jgi:hypothetical protein
MECTFLLPSRLASPVVASWKRHLVDEHDAERFEPSGAMAKTIVKADRLDDW